MGKRKLHRQEVILLANCPKCGALKGQPCHRVKLGKDYRAVPRVSQHAARWEEAKKNKW